MENLALLALCFLAAPLLRGLGRLPEGMPAGLNAFIIHMALPATVLVHIPALRVDASMALAASMAWIVFGLTGLVALASGRVLGWDRGTVGCVWFVAGLGNTSFLGLPVTQALIGPEAAGVVVVCDQAGSFLALSTLGLLVVARFSGTAADPRAMLRRIVTFPPFVALVAAFGVRALGGLEGVALGVAERLAGTLAPLALFSVGAQLRLEGIGHNRGPLIVGLTTKLLLAPLAVAGVALSVGVGGLVGRVSILEAAMPPMITAGILATQHDLKPHLASLLVGVGIVISAATLPLVWWISRTM